MSLNAGPFGVLLHIGVCSMDTIVHILGLYGLVGCGACIGYMHRRWADWGELALVFLLWPILIWDNYNG